MGSPSQSTGKVSREYLPTTHRGDNEGDADLAGVDVPDELALSFDPGPALGLDLAAVALIEALVRAIAIPEHKQFRAAVMSPVCHRNGDW